MSDQIQLQERTESPQISSVGGGGAIEGPEGSQTQKKWTLKGMLMMAACCGAPLLLLLAIPLFGFSLAGVGGALLPFIVLLACPVGMYLMMRMMSKR
ncbi:MAG: hypothetical protein ACE5HC_12800 [Candidatus Binatia bacterium]